MAYRIDILTLFPDSMNSVLGESIIGRAAKKGTVEINCIQIRDYTENRQMQVDDYPYGGGWGLVMMAQPLKSCLDDIVDKSGERKTRVIYMSPQGKPYNQTEARRLRNDYDHLVLICGHYEGVDERFIEECVDEEISLGDFVLTGGEIAAMAIADSVCRIVPGVLADEECFTGESHWDGLLEYPQYTRPENWQGRRVPEVLLGGDRSKIDAWRKRKQLERTMDKRPDMFVRLSVTNEKDKIIMDELMYDRLPEREKLVFDYRRAELYDIKGIMTIADMARSFLKQSNVDQWQDGYPTQKDIEYDIAHEQGWVFICNGELAGYICISMISDKSYELIDGAWLTDSDSDYTAAHRVMVSEKYRGTKLASEMFSLAFDLAQGMGRGSVRGDTHKDNRSMNGLLTKLGFTLCGVVQVSLNGTGHDTNRNGYEKLVSI